MDQEGLFDRLAARIGMLFFAGLGAWLAYEHMPISLFFLLSLTAAYGLTIWKPDEEPEAAEATVARRLLLGLVRDLRRVAFCLSIGFGLVWIVQIVLNLSRSSTSPAEVLEMELAIFRLADGLRDFDWIAVAMIAMAFMVSAVTSAYGSMLALGALRRLLAAATVILAAVGTFTFVSVDRAAAKADFAAPGIQAEIRANVARLAEARQQHAALQWMSVEFTQEIRDIPESRTLWSRYFASAADNCSWLRESSRRTMRESMELDPFGRERTDPSSEMIFKESCDADGGLHLVAAGRARGAPDGIVSPIAHWTPEFAFLLDPEAGSTRPRAWRWPDEFGALMSLRDRTARAAREAEQARDALRSAASDSIASLLGVETRGAAGQILAVFQNAVVEAIIRESENRISQRIAAIRIRIVDFLSAPPALRGLRETGFPIESPAKAQGADGDVEWLAYEDRQHAAPAPARTADRTQQGPVVAPNHPVGRRSGRR